MIGKIIVKKVGQKAEVVEIDMNNLKAMQNIVEGYITTVKFTDDVLIVCNEDGERLELKPNVGVHDIVILGNIFFCSWEGEDFTGLNDGQIENIMKLFNMLDNGI